MAVDKCLIFFNLFIIQVHPLPPSGVGIGFELDGPMVPVLIEVAPIVSKTKEIAPNDPIPV